MKNILLVNPWIYDFAAYDLWIKPWGLLKISSILKKNGFNVFFIDTLDRHHPLIKESVKDTLQGTGKFIAEEVEKPYVFQGIPRKFKRYGLPLDLFKKALPSEQIDMIFVSSGMTYWYPGPFKAIEILKEKYENVEIVLGGTYATLSYKHALNKSGADHVIKNSELYRISGISGKKMDLSFSSILNEEIEYSMYKDPLYGVLRLSLGCPFDCAYCAQKHLGPGFILKDIKKALGEVRYLYDRGISIFAFYDDALLFDDSYIREYMEYIIKDGIKADFYTPNGLHARFISDEIAVLMKKMNMVNPILSLETSSDREGKQWHSKITKEELRGAVSKLNSAGYGKGEYTVYLMLGIPGSINEHVIDSIDFIHSLGGRISLSEFSPIPGTPLASGFRDSLDEPLLQNNSAFPSFRPEEWTAVREIKAYARRLNEKFLV